MISTLVDSLHLDLKSKVIAFPTDTVYGVGALIGDIDAISKIYELKKRDYSKPLAILVDEKDVSKYAYNFEGKVKEIAYKYWPGALTIILKKKEIISDFVTSNLDTVGLRMPNSNIALKLTSQFGPLATTSVNISGSSPINNKDEIIKYFKDYIDYIIKEEEPSSNKSSSVIRVLDNGEIEVLRKGDIEF